MGNKLHVGIHNRTVEKYMNELVGRGYKVAIVDQVENSDEMMERVACNGGKGSKVLLREISEVVTKGTLRTGGGDGVDSRYLMALWKRGQSLGIVLVECSTNSLLLAYIPHDFYYDKLKTMIL
jgi:DNA mismatch repair ATPase MutS